MAILNTIKFIKMRFKTLSGYIKYALTSDSVIMENGKDLQTEINTIHNNLAYEFGKIVMTGTPKGCNAVIADGNSWYMRIGKMITFCVEVSLSRTGSSMSEEIRIPCLPYPTRNHSTFATGYQNAIIKANGHNDNVHTVIKAGSYGNVNEIYLLESNSARMWNVNQGELMSNGVLLISGSYFIN